MIRRRGCGVGGKLLFNGVLFCSDFWNCDLYYSYLVKGFVWDVFFLKGDFFIGYLLSNIGIEEN